MTTASGLTVSGAEPVSCPVASGSENDDVRAVHICAHISCTLGGDILPCGEMLHILFGKFLNSQDAFTTPVSFDRLCNFTDDVAFLGEGSTFDVVLFALQVCDICGETFEQFWDEDAEEWHLKDALRVNNKVRYAWLCWEEFCGKFYFLVFCLSELAVLFFGISCL